MQLSADLEENHHSINVTMHEICHCQQELNQGLQFVKCQSCQTMAHRF